MKFKLSTIFIVMGILWACPKVYSQVKKNIPIYLQIKLPADLKIDSLELNYTNWKPHNYSNQSSVQQTKLNCTNGMFEWKGYLQQPVNFSNDKLRDLNFLLAPGDSVVIDTRMPEWSFSGAGSEKLMLMYSINNESSKIPQPGYSPRNRMSEKDLLELNQYLDQRNEIAARLLSKFESTIPKNHFDYIKASILTGNESGREAYFSIFVSDHYRNMAKDKFCRLYDSLVLNDRRKWIYALKDDVVDHNFSFYAVVNQLKRNRNFSSSGLSEQKASLKTRIDGFKEVQQMFTGMPLANALHNLVGHEGIYRFGFIPEMKKMLKEFYSLEVTTPLHEDMRAIEKKQKAIWKEKLTGRNKKRNVEGVFKNDGPYLLERNDNTVLYSFVKDKLSKQFYQDRSKVVLTAKPDGDKVLSIPLQAKLANAAPEYAMPGKLLALSDIEGNFFAFKNLLKSNGVMDEDYNWTYVDGHLVLIGDFFDRGEQVTECLWLIYLLEQQARKAGGEVHFILGNHEIMNMTGSTSYVRPKYHRNAEKMGMKYDELFSKNTELGKWLRTKNVMERIGTLLFVHGGVSPQMNRMAPGIDQVNNAARSVLESSTGLDNPDLTGLVNSTGFGPYWYRGYYKEKDKQMMEKVVDSTLQIYRVRHVVTGHSIVADTISTHFNKKVIDTDVHHANGKSAALLVEGKNFYRVNDKGQRVLLFKEE